MKQFVNITSIQNPQVNIQAVKCITFGCQLRGLMLQKFLRPHEGMLFIENYESRLFLIHMLFMNFNITVIWLNENNRVVDKKNRKTMDNCSPSEKTRQIYPGIAREPD
jgi:uncharacterized membrane protein (UPF0127 family)